MLYLSRADVAACGITPARMNDVVEAVFLAEAQGTAWTQPKLAIFRPDGSSFRAKAGATIHMARKDAKTVGFVACGTQARVMRQNCNAW